MPKDKTETLLKIIPSAMKEFLANGFTGASMRSIAAGAGITAAGLYAHFDSKEAMFEALVSPVYEEFIRRYTAECMRSLEQLEAGGMGPMWASSQSTFTMFMEYIYDHLDVFRLLIGCSEQTPYEHFTHAVIDLEVNMTERYLDRARELGHPVRNVDSQELHILSNAQFSCIFEMVLHAVPRERALAMADDISGFFAAGWKAFLLG